MVGTVFYTNDVDEDGKPITHTHIPDDVYKQFRAIAEQVLVDSGLPRDQEKRQELFTFLKTAKKAYGFIIATVIGSILVALLSMFEINIKSRPKQPASHKVESNKYDEGFE